MDTEKRELWDRLQNEPERAYRAFESYLSLPSGERTLLEAYRSHVGNLHAKKCSDTWSRWSSSFAWRERAAAYDDHLANMRRSAYERGVEEEAERQGLVVERRRNQMNELMTRANDLAIEWLEEAQASEDIGALRAQDVINILKLNLEAEKQFGSCDVDSNRDDWTEEDDAEFADTILKETKEEIGTEEADEDKEDSDDTQED